MRFERYRCWERAMDDIEDPRGIELRQLRDGVRHPEAQQSGQAAVAEASYP
jgi:hypothetical protein